MTTYSTSLKLSLIADGDQAGTWGQTTNTNLGTLLEQAITGVVAITMLDANYTLSNLNGVSDEARNAVLVVGGTNTAQRNVIAPAVEKLYTVKNATVGGFAIQIKTSGGTGVVIPNGMTTTVYCDGTDFYEQKTGTTGAFTIGGNATVGGTLGVTGALSGTTGSFSGDVTFPTQSAGNNTTKAATTAFVVTAVTNGLGTLGTMSSQNANNVNISGGSITGITDLAVADGGTGRSSLTSNNVLLGNGTSAVQFVAPSTNGNVLTSNGTTWISSAPATPFAWNVTYVNTSVSSGSAYSLPSNCIGIFVWCTIPGSGNNGGIGRAQVRDGSNNVLGTLYVNGTNVGGGADGGSGMTDGAGSFLPMSSSANNVYFDVVNNAVSGTFTVQAYITRA